MRISDWSSDVCSSYLHASVAQLAEQRSPKPQVVGSSPTWRATCGSYAKRGSPRTNPPTGQSGNFVNSRVEQPKSASPADVAMYALAVLLVVAGALAAVTSFGYLGGFLAPDADARSLPIAVVNL